MRHSLLFLLFLPLLTRNALAQSSRSYDDLLVLYVDENYEKCIFKAERYTERDATRRDPLPYLYMSMCFHEISKMDKYTDDPDFKNAGRDALKYAEKFRKKDKENAYFAQYEDYWEELNAAAMGVGFMYLEEGSYSKAKREFDRMTGYDPENAGAWLMLALSQMKMNLMRDAEESLVQFRHTYAKMGDHDRLSPDRKRLLREALIRYAEQLDNKGMRDSARTTLALGAEDFMDNAEFKALHDELN
ncbi:MAG: hypothetical protein H6595_03430 [Flavobacteriales bacterium]|nr:hypothetical protein [Flavobacteriales bacterium]MCB9166510.1 hypothetical protein [Flavobacteriales bacterium]